MSNRGSIKYPGATTSISKVHINNMYIKYTFHFAILLIRQILGAVPLLVTSPFEVEALNLRLRSRLGLLHLSSNLLAVLIEVPLLPFALFLEAGGLVDHQHFMFFLDFNLCRLQQNTSGMVPRPICDPIQKELEGPTKDRPAY